jgi:hypothetical protein
VSNDGGSDANLDAPAPSDVSLPDAIFLPDGDPLSPVVMIHTPSDGEVRLATSLVPFIGMGHDSTGAQLTGTQLIWTDAFGSNTTVMGTGTYVPYSLRTVGDHVITLTGIDRMGHGASMSITVTAQ